MASLIGHKFLQRGLTQRTALKRLDDGSSNRNSINHKNQLTVTFPSVHYSSDSLDLQKNQIGQDNKDYSESTDIPPKPSRTYQRSLFLNRIEYNENNYIYNHVHKRLNSYASMGQKVTLLPIYPEIVALKEILSSGLMPQQREESISQVLNNINSIIKYMNQQELAILLTYIKNQDCPEFTKIMRMIDIELRWLLKTHVGTRLMDLDLWFYCADVFYECLFRSTFVNVLVNYMVRENEISMSNAQFLHLLFLVILQRKQLGALTTYEDRILQLLKNASFADLATICMAYFKTQTPITNPQMLAQIIDKTTEFLPQIDPQEPGYCSIIKSIRYSFMTGCRENVSQLIMSLTNDTDYNIIMASPYNLVHTVKLMESYRIYDKKLLQLLYAKMFDDLECFRIKDIQYALTSLSNFAYGDLVLTQKMKQDFSKLSHDIISDRRQDSGPQYFHLMPLLRAFAIFGYYDKELIEYTFSGMLNAEKFALMRPALEFDKSALLVYVSCMLEGKIDPGKLKHLENEKFMSHMHCLSNSIERVGNMGSVRKDSSIGYLKFLLKGSDIPEYYINSNLYRNISIALESNDHLKDSSYNLKFQFTMPHQNYADLVITKNHTAPGSFNKETLMPKKVPENEKHCILLATMKADYLDGYERLSGYKMMCRRLLENLGYIVINVDLNNPEIDALAIKIKTSLN